VRLTGQTFMELVNNGTGLSTGEGTDTVICDCLTGDSATSATVTLPAGNHPIEAGMFERAGGAYLRVWAAEVGAVQPPPLGIASGGPYSTAAGLQLTAEDPGTEPGGGATISNVALSADGQGLTITYTGTLEAADSLGGPWTAVANATSPATIPISGAQRFFRVR
jgi:hypothetical protein